MMPTRMVSAREIVGKRIIGFKPNPRADGRGGTTHSPVIVLDDGSMLIFQAIECEAGYDHGVFMRRQRITK